MLKYFQISILFIALVLASSCAAGKKAPVSPSTGGPELTEKEQLEFAHLFYDAEKDKLLGNFSLAQEKFQQAYN